MGDTHPTPAENTSATSAMLEGREVDPTVLAGDIDSRMEALLKDHQEMGARPAKEPVSADTFPPDLPLSQNKAPKARPQTELSDRPVSTSSVPTTDEPKAAAKTTTKKAAAKK